jgi:hypothetical protein
MRISIDQSADRFDFNKTDAAVEYQQARMSDKRQDTRLKRNTATGLSVRTVLQTNQHFEFPPSGFGCFDPEASRSVGTTS